MDRPMSATQTLPTLPDWIQYASDSGTYLVTPVGGDRAVAELVISHRGGETFYFLYEVERQYTEDGEIFYGGDQIYSGTDWDQCLRDAAQYVSQYVSQSEIEEITEYEYRLEVQTICCADSGFPKLADRKYITFYSDVNNAVSIATNLLKEIDPANCWGAELWNQSMRYRMEYKWDISNKYARSNQQCWLDWTGKQL